MMKIKQQIADWLKGLKYKLLFLTAWFLVIPATIVNRRVVRKIAKDKGKGYYFNSAKNLDIWACREFRAMWNKYLITEDGVKFGGEGQTISEVLGLNLLKGTLTVKGLILCGILEVFETEHVLKAIETRELRKNKK